MSLRQGQVHRRVGRAGSFHALLLLDLPEDSRYRRLRDQSRCRRAEHDDHRQAITCASTELAFRHGGKAGTHLSSARRYFCAHCGSALWVWDPTWPELVHPHAGAIDTPLPIPPENVHCLVGSKAPWVKVEGEPDRPSLRALSQHVARTMAPRARASPRPSRLVGFGLEIGPGDVAPDHLEFRAGRLA